MKKSQFQLPDQSMYVYKWEPDVDETKQPVQGIVQIVHGSCEHADRYDAFARFLASHGWVVYASDLRGHGHSVSTREDLGYFGEQDGWSGLVREQHVVTKQIREEHPGLPVVMFGHSMGSFVARDYAIRYGAGLAGLILSGTAHHSRGSLHAGRLLADQVIRTKGIRYRSKILYNLTYNSFNKRFEPNRTGQDWLTRDPSIVDTFIQDELCGFVFTAGGFRDMFEGLLNITNPGQIAQTPKELPVFLLSGADDPVGGFGKMVERAYRSYRKAGLHEVRIKLYEGMRHEILNELGKEEVYEDILTWMSQTVCKKTNGERM
jgi:alpha-beta hydrolase superfamily lysophospholipase